MPAGLTCGIGIPAVPGAPSLSTVSSGALPARTYYVQYTYSNNLGETLAGTEGSIAIAANYVLKVSSPSTWTNATSYTVYVSETSGAEELQATEAIGTDWQEPNTGLIVGANPPTSVPTVDLDSVFLGYVSPHTKATDTDIEVTSALQELSDRYEKLSYGSASSATGILARSTLADLNIYFAANNSGAGSWMATLPAFPNPLTKSPQPYPTGTNSMTVTQTNGPGGTYTYVWSSSIIPSGDPGSFTIVSGSGTDTIEWYATAANGQWITIKVQCEITSSVSDTSVTAKTTMKFQIGTPS